MSVQEAIAVAASGAEVQADLLEKAFGEIMCGVATPAQIAGLLVALRTKGETVDEIVAVTRALRAAAAAAPEVDPRTVDCCGTGGSGVSTFNISTTAAFVVAGAGVPVAKHGNRAATSRSGSFDVLEALGVRIELPVDASARILAEIGIAAFFARTAHPAFRFVAPVRQDLGLRTLMNCVGPLLNPVGAQRQLVGVYDGALVEPLARALGKLGSKRALVVHGSDGLDEITTTGPTKAALLHEGEVSFFDLTPAELGIPEALAADLTGGDPEENAQILRSILAGEPGPRRDIVLLNAAGALMAASDREPLVANWKVEIDRARESIDSGAAKERLAELVRASQEAAEQ